MSSSRLQSFFRPAGGGLVAFWLVQRASCSRTVAGASPSGTWWETMVALPGHGVLLKKTKRIVAGARWEINGFFLTCPEMFTCCSTLPPTRHESAKPYTGSSIPSCVAPYRPALCRPGGFSTAAFDQATRQAFATGRSGTSRPCSRTAFRLTLPSASAKIATQLASRTLQGSQ